MRRRIATLVLALALGASAPAAHGGEPPEPTFADKPPSWWVDQLVAGDVKDAAREVLQRMGEGAAPALAARLSVTRATTDRLTILRLLAGCPRLPPSVAPHLRTSLAAPDPSERILALKAARLIGKDAAPIAGEVAENLASTEDKVREAACDALGAMGDASLPWVPALAKCLGDVAVSGRAAAALTALGPGAAEALPTLLALAESRPPSKEILTALAALAPEDARAGAAIACAASSSSEPVSRAARALVAQSLTPGAALLAAATSLAASEDSQCRVAAATGLGRWTQAKGEVPEELFRLLCDKEISVASAAVRALVPLAATQRTIVPRVGAAWMESPHPRAFTELLYALRPEIGPVLFDAAACDREALRTAAWHVLSRTGPRGLDADVPRLKKCLFDDRIALDVRAGLIAVLQSQQVARGEAAGEVFASVVREGAPALAVRAAWSLMEEDAHRGALIAAAARPELEVRQAAFAAMPSLAGRHEDVRATLVGALSDEAEPVRLAALGALQRAGSAPWTKPSPARDTLVARLAASVDGDADSRRVAGELLGALPADARPAATLVALLRHDDSADRAVGLLLASSDAAPLLRRAADGEDQVVAARAVRVLLVHEPSDALAARIGKWIEAEDVRVARAAALAVERLTDARVLQIGGALARAARAGREGVASPACRALSRIARDEVVARDALLAVADDPGNTAHGAVTPFLPDLGAPGATRLAKLLESPDREARRNACNAIRDAGRRAACPALNETLPALDRLAAGDDLELARVAREAAAALRR